MDEVLLAIEDALDTARENKPEERGELARYIAIIITDLEKVRAYARWVAYDLPHLEK